MSDEEISKEGGEGGLPTSSEDGKKQKGNSRKIRKAEKVGLFRKFKKLGRKKKSTSSADPGKSCFLCFKPPVRSDSPNRSQPSDPNTPEFGFEYLKTLIERNDFYAKECNVHV